MSNLRRIVVIAGAIVCVLVVQLIFHLPSRKAVPVPESPCDKALAALARLDQALRLPASSELPSLVLMPPALAAKSEPEQVEFLAKVLKDEISTEGLAVLKTNGQFGPLVSIFPGEATNWAMRAGVSPESCVAFRAEGNGVTAEAVFCTNSIQWRIVRINNIHALGTR